MGGYNIQAKNLKRYIGIIIGSGFKKRNKAITFFYFNFQMEYDKASIVHDHKDNRKAGGQNPLAVTKGQFCAMIYHGGQEEKRKQN